MEQQEQEQHEEDHNDETYEVVTHFPNPPFDEVAHCFEQ
jgi:hypothetical protein